MNPTMPPRTITIVRGGFLNLLAGILALVLVETKLIQS